MKPLPGRGRRSFHTDQRERRTVAGNQTARPASVGDRVILTYLIPFVLYHAALPLTLVPWLFSWSGLLLIPILHFLFDWVGIGLCFHRTLTHGSLVLPKWLERTFVILGLCNLMDSPARWVAIHRKHHKHADEQSDPHTPLVTVWWGHMGWLMRENEEFSQIGFYLRYAPDILRDRFYLNIERYRLWAVIYFVHAGLLTAGGFVTGWLRSGTYQAGIQLALSWLLWAVIVRTLFSWHTTFAVNSVTHIWGYRNYDTRDNSTNNWVIALLTGGEGWHNNHHAYPVSAAHGHKWWEVDPTYLNIRLLGHLGLANQIKMRAGGTQEASIVPLPSNVQPRRSVPAACHGSAATQTLNKSNDRIATADVK